MSPRPPADSGRSTEAVIFDLDGTLIDTLADIAASVNAALAWAGLPPRSPDEIKPKVGWGLRSLVSSLLDGGDQSDSFIDSLTERTVAAYARFPVVHTKPYAGIPETLASLSDLGVKTAVLSNKAGELVSVILKRVFPDHAFAQERGMQARFKPKPDPGQCLDIVKALGTGIDRCLFAGDSPVDIQTARSAGLPVIACLWGYRPEGELLGVKPDYIARYPLDIIEIIGRLDGDARY